MFLALTIAVVVSGGGPAPYAAPTQPMPLQAPPQREPKFLISGISPTGSPITARLVEALRETSESDELSTKGNEAAQEHAWQAAVGLYKQSLAVWKDNTEADYGLAHCYAALGDKAKEIEAYRAGVYNGAAKPGNLRGGSTVTLMTYVLRLSQAGQMDEAGYVYNDTAKKMNDYEKVSNLGLLLPVFGSGPGQATYTPARLQAMAYVALGVPSQDNQTLTGKEKLAHLQEAVRLAPDCADPYYHLGAHLERLDPAQSQAAYAKAAKLDSAVPGAFAKMAAEKPQ